MLSLLISHSFPAFPRDFSLYLVLSRTFSCSSRSLSLFNSILSHFFFLIFFYASSLSVESNYCLIKKKKKQSHSLLFVSRCFSRFLAEFSKFWRHYLPLSIANQSFSIANAHSTLIWLQFSFWFSWPDFKKVIQVWIFYILFLYPLHGRVLSDGRGCVRSGHNGESKRSESSQVNEMNLGRKWTQKKKQYFRSIRVQIRSKKKTYNLFTSLSGQIRSKKFPQKHVRSNQVKGSLKYSTVLTKVKSFNPGQLRSWKIQCVFFFSHIQ